MGEKKRDFPGGSVVRTPRFHCSEHRFDPWVGKLRSHMPLSLAKKLCLFFFLRQTSWNVRSRKSIRDEIS